MSYLLLHAEAPPLHQVRNTREHTSGVSYKDFMLRFLTTQSPELV